jgi:hypothetical protein
MNIKKPWHALHTSASRIDKDTPERGYHTLQRLLTL